MDLNAWVSALAASGAASAVVGAILGRKLRNARVRHQLAIAEHEEARKDLTNIEAAGEVVQILRAELTSMRGDVAKLHAENFRQQKQLDECARDRSALHRELAELKEKLAAIERRELERARAGGV